ncbi:efflux RND transporter periplasmic adaptor subunit [Roseobacter denitrificans]|uniref:RND efflux transporter, MFP subunit n=2 Tax=Roseobacter denitrificans TaxID=2434 RepID=Q166K1_ROSDO|nr:RND efflux transporter, MFP subunit [Roseobacter denitrificans OCh 114]AVL54718.1 efflux RND transporter periplasmic adaptor subunit [Roseobacter denitrificans]SFF77220.1 membrane fusion protein, multidrug efflux system [Roseobacter denitrificans OCh 114]
MTYRTSLLHTVQRGIILVACLALTIGLSTTSAQSQDGSNPPPKVVIAAAYSEELTREATFVGRGEASAKTDLIARVTGIITEMVVQDGATVKEGDVIFRIEPDTYQAELQAQQAAVQRADANVKLAEIELVRKTELLRREAIAESELDIAQANAAVAKADLLAAQAALREAELNLERTDITAPFDGRIGRSSISLGALVGPSTGPLATLVQESPMYVTFSLSEPQLLGVLERLETGMEELIASGASPNVFIRLPDGTMLEEPGTIVFLDNRINPATGTISLRAEFENTRRMILDGGFISVVIEALEPTLSVLIPQNAVQRDQRGDFVLVVTDQQLVEQRYVVLGPQAETAVVVSEGLREGESVIVEGLQRVRPGIEVNAVLTGTSDVN